ncbi:hypothetical protein CkaCkLH20_13281 [Colletotrichum karsti]|uniref:Uncharacterized protein n=1 Tax=Colletotrichum karsti TaxID=1095194 RepID=A0A9P6LDM2_9PEZI|nr:uncharacterized protein CkaCkLH20_13281 [Colletotrichum karsti]KAF9869248.1 hypothetical protein CkaCkLH20_13281 [Colletotrichum karsti]
MESTLSLLVLPAEHLSLAEMPDFSILPQLLTSHSLDYFQAGQEINAMPEVIKVGINYRVVPQNSIPEIQHNIVSYISHHDGGTSRSTGTASPFDPTSNFETRNFEAQLQRATSTRILGLPSGPAISIRNLDVEFAADLRGATSRRNFEAKTSRLNFEAQLRRATPTRNSDVEFAADLRGSTSRRNSDSQLPLATSMSTRHN